MFWIPTQDFLGLKKNLQLKYSWLPFLVGKKFHQLDEKSIEKQSCSSDSWSKPKHSTTSLTDWSKKPRSDKSAAQKNKH